MRYWAYFALKLAVAAVPLLGLLALINRAWPATENPSALTPLSDAYDILVYDLVVLAWFLLCAAVLALIVLDQRRRCRVCLRRLRMPVATGSWGRILLFGPPRIERICPYGHGSLREGELHITGAESPEWKPSQGFWEDLAATRKKEER